MKIFCVDIIASHYRKAIFQMMDNAYDMTFLFGKTTGSVKAMDISQLNGEVIITNTLQLWKGWYWQPGVVIKAFQNYNYYILNGESRSLSAWLFCLLACVLGKRKKVFFWSHGWYGKETKLESVVKKILFHLPGGGIFLYGNYARNLMIREGFNENKLFVIHNSLDYERQLFLRKQIGLTDVFSSRFGNNNKVIIVIGRLNYRKQLHLLLEAISSLNDKKEYYNVVFVGDGEARQQLEKISKQYGILSQVWFYGACYEEKTNAELIYNADICIMPGDIGLTAIHCLMFGTPCITHNRYSHQGPEFEAIKAGVTGDFFNYGDISSLEGKISYWFENHSDRDVIRQACYKEIDEQWTPYFQMAVLNNAFNGNGTV